MAYENAVNGRSQEPDTSLMESVMLPTAEGEAEALLRSTLDALSAHVAVLDETGTIVMVNQAWKEFAISTGYTGRDFGLGANYLAVCERAASGSDDAGRTAAALRDVMAGRRESFR